MDGSILMICPVTYINRKNNSTTVSMISGQPFVISRYFLFLWPKLIVFNPIYLNLNYCDAVKPRLSKSSLLARNPCFQVSSIGHYWGWPGRRPPHLSTYFSTSNGQAFIKIPLFKTSMFDPPPFSPAQLYTFVFEKFDFIYW